MIAGQEEESLKADKGKILAEMVKDYIGCRKQDQPSEDDPEKIAGMEQLLWEILVENQKLSFLTAKGLSYTYSIRGNEMFVDRKDKSLTRATVQLAFQNALFLQRRGEPVSGPKKLKTFGASYLFPIFVKLGIILPGSERII